MKNRIFAFLLAALLLVTCALTSISVAFCHKSLWLETAARALPEQRILIRERITAIAAELPFQPETALGYYDDATLERLSRETALWLFSLFGAGESAVPSYAADGLAEAIVNDPLYQQKGPAYQKRIIARENGAYAIEQAVARALLPVRSSILGKAAERLPLHRVRQILWTAVVAMWALTLLWAGLILLLNRGQLTAGVAWAGAGLVAGSLAAFAALIPAAFLRVTETVAQVSEAFAQSAAFFTERLTLCHSLICLVPLAAGLLLMRAANGVRPKQKNEA